VCLPRSDAATVWVRDGEVLTSDGRVAGTKGQVGGCCLVDGKALDEAVEVACRLPGARTGPSRSRPSWGLEG
jgi:hypothetical protein